MIRRCLPHLLLILLCLAPAACSRAIVQAQNPAPFRADDYKPTYDAAIEVLRGYGFVIDQHDYRFGQITTLPLGSPTLFEIWDPQNTTADQTVESTLADEQRRVTVTLLRQGPPDTGDPHAQDPGPTYQLQVRVTLERKQVVTRRLVGSAQNNIFSNLAAPPENLAGQGVTSTYWLPVGQDPYLEARLIKQITERAATTSAR